jgi:conjugal transfer pilus assembly protein TraF
MLPILLSVGLIVALAPAVAMAQDTPTQAPRGDAAQERFSKDRERGWHWYEERPEPEEPELEKPPTPTASPTTAPPPVMSARWLKEEFEKATEMAISEPTPVNVEYWAYLRKLVLDKSERFAEVAAQVTASNPVLDETIENPVNSAAIDARNTVKTQARQETLAALKDKVSLVYFHRSDCAYCQRMEPVLERLRQETGIRITGVSMDGQPVPPTVADSWMIDRGQARMLGVTSTPTFYLFGENKELVRTQIGATTFTGLTDKILRAARQGEWISQSELEVAMLGAEKNLFVDRVNSTIDWSNPEQALAGLKALEAVAVDRANAEEINSGQATPVVIGE